MDFENQKYDLTGDIHLQSLTCECPPPLLLSSKHELDTLSIHIAQTDTRILSAIVHLTRIAYFLLYVLSFSSFIEEQLKEGHTPEKKPDPIAIGVYMILHFVSFATFSFVET